MEDRSEPRLTVSWSWATVTAVLALSALMTVSLSRFFEWDEAVFFGQSGGYQGADAPAPALAASREVGPALVIRVLRTFASDLAEVRFLWMAVSIALIVHAYRSLEKHVGRTTAIIACLTFGTFWITLVFTASFYGSLFGAVLSLAATATYLDLRDRPSSAKGAILGVLVAGAFWMRQIETAIVLAVLIGHFIMVGNRGGTIRSRVRSIAAAVGTVTLLFAIPWTIDSIVRFGSVTERIRSARSQNYPRGLTNNLLEYGRLLSGDGHYGTATEIPSTAVVGFGAVGVMLALGLLAAAAVAFLGKENRFRSRPVARPPTGLMVALTLVSAFFFIFYVDLVRERYILYASAFAAVVVGRVAASIPSPRTSRRNVWTLGLLVLAAWLGMNQIVAQPIQSERVAQAATGERIATVIRVLADGRPCAGIARYNAPSIQVGSGCRVSAGSGPAVAREFADEAGTRAGQLSFVVWPDWSELDMPADWQRIGVPVENRADRSISVYYSRQGDRDIFRNDDPG